MEDEPRIDKYEVNPYAARAFILNLESEYNLTIRIKEGKDYCVIYIDKEAKDDGSEMR